MTGTVAGVSEAPAGDVGWQGIVPEVHRPYCVVSGAALGALSHEEKQQEKCKFSVKARMLQES